MAISNSTSEPRNRVWATIVYPESAPENWLTILSDLVVPCFVSPLHDKDLNPTGEPKKAHYHVLFYFEGKKSSAQMQEIVSQIGGVGLEAVKTMRGYSRYLCHLDNPEKHQYNIEEVKQYGGLDYVSTIGLAIDKYKAIKEMFVFCDDTKTYNFADLVTYASDNEPGWFRVLCDNGAYIVKEWMKSRSWGSSHGDQ